MCTTTALERSTITFEGAPFAVSEVGSEIAQLLDLAKLRTYVSRADQISSAGADGKKVYRCALSNRLLRVTKTGDGSMEGPKVLRIEAAFTLNNRGDVVAIEFNVVHSDPYADMMMMDGADGTNISTSTSVKIEGVEGGLDDLPKQLREQIQKAMEAQEAKIKQQRAKGGKEGKTTNYRFETIDDVSKNIRDFAARMREMGE